MANKEHLAELKKGVKHWNQWRKDHPDIMPDLSEVDFTSKDVVGELLWDEEKGLVNLSRVDFSRAYLREANLSGVYLYRANLIEACLFKANLSGAILKWVYLSQANLIEADLRDASLERATLAGTQLGWTKLDGANLSRAMLETATLVETKLYGADLSGARIYGISVWDVKTDANTRQEGLVITREDEPTITVDDLEVAQFIYLLLTNNKIRNVLDTITRKVVLILGRFTEDRMAVLDAIADELRELGYLPVIFKFDPSPEKNILDTVRILAHMSRFVIMDFTDAKFILAEATAVVKINVAIQPIIEVGQELGTIRGILADAQRMLDLHEYRDVDDLLPALRDNLVPAAEEMAEYWTKRRDEWGKPSKTAEDAPPE